MKSCTIKHFLRNSNIFPILYANICTNMMTMEHVIPKCYIKNNLAQKDFHNMYATPACWNFKRSNYMFGELNYNQNKTIIDTKLKLIYPRDCDKGVIARSILYMVSKYNIEYDVNMTMIYEWNKQYKPSFKEICHNEFVNNIQGNKNPFITLQKNDIDFKI